MRRAVPVLLTLFLLMQASSAFKVQAEAGETYIRWTWPSNYTFDVYVDGELKGSTTMNFYYLKDLKPNEEHRLDLMNVSSEIPIKTSVVKTTAPSGLIWIMVIICLILSVLVIFLDGWPVVIVGCVIEVCGIFGRSIAYGHFGIDWLFIGFMIFAGVYIVKAIYEIGKGEIAWY